MLVGAVCSVANSPVEYRTQPITMLIACLIAHAIVCVSVVAVALMRKLHWAAGLSVVGVIAGYVLAIGPLLLLMTWSERTTGFGAGNAGVFFVCTIPIVPLFGIAGGAALGYSIDQRKPTAGCPNCGYDMRGIDSARCPECGCHRGEGHAA